MNDTIYESLYYMMFNAATDAAAALGRGEADAAALILIRAQQAAEERFICAAEDDALADPHP